ncbi:class I SAM-dependent methyltransferase [Aurantiacibacter flavus]|uniref:Class I SAM-dependent methyltransferase n=1 Tax=Aurantiacibacter flavus TaxID=3145232 RepID=A0ABV0CZN3_9SPHN
MTGQPQEHWGRVYSDKAPGDVSWFQSEPRHSLDALVRFGLPATTPFVDIGGGASTLVDALLVRGWSDVTVVDIAAPALAAAQARLGEKAARVQWEVADITRWNPPRRYGVWHDRAVFHFLTEPEQQTAFRRALLAGTAPDAHVIIATFAPDGPEKCSGLPVQRHDAASLAAALGSEFTLLDDWREEHLTPWGTAQKFIWCVFQRADD